MYCATANLRDCLIVNNEATGTTGSDGVDCGMGGICPLEPAGPGGDAYGAGLYCHSSGATLENCTISGNAATAGVSGEALTSCPSVPSGDAYGGGIYCDSGAASIENSTVSENTARGAVSSYECSNRGNGMGGGIGCGPEATVEVSNCAVVNNEAAGGDGYEYCGGRSGGGDAFGGGMHCSPGGELIIESCTLAGNSATPGELTLPQPWAATNGAAEADAPIVVSEDSSAYGAGLWCGAGSAASANNCILWANDGNDIDGSG
jgi:hypothetical protein